MLDFWVILEEVIFLSTSGSNLCSHFFPQLRTNKLELEDAPLMNIRRRSGRKRAQILAIKTLIIDRIVTILF